MKVVKALSSEKLGAVFYVTDTGVGYGVTTMVRTLVGDAFVLMQLQESPEHYKEAPKDIIDMFIVDAQTAGDLVTKDFK